MNRKEQLLKELNKLKDQYPEFKLFVNAAIEMIKRSK